MWLLQGIHALEQILVGSGELGAAGSSTVCEGELGSQLKA